MLKKVNKIFSKEFVTSEPTKYGLRNFLMDVFRWSLKKGMLKKEKKIFSKQFVRMKRNLNEICFKV